MSTPSSGSRPPTEGTPPAWATSARIEISLTDLRKLLDDLMRRAYPKMSKRKYRITPDDVIAELEPSEVASPAVVPSTGQPEPQPPVSGKTYLVTASVPASQPDELPHLLRIFVYVPVGEEPEAQLDAFLSRHDLSILALEQRGVAMSFMELIPGMTFFGVPRSGFESLKGLAALADSEAAAAPSPGQEEPPKSFWLDNPMTRAFWNLLSREGTDGPLHRVIVKHMRELEDAAARVSPGADDSPNLNPDSVKALRARDFKRINDPRATAGASLAEADGRVIERAEFVASVLESAGADADGVVPEWLRPGWLAEEVAPLVRRLVPLMKAEQERHRLDDAIRRLEAGQEGA